MTNKTRLLKNITKHISLHNYHKETGELKVKSENGSPNGSGSKNLKPKVRSDTGSENFSWRKKSNDTTSQTSNGYNSNDKSSNYSRHKDSHYNYNNYKRERFNSEGNHKTFHNNKNYSSPSTNKFEEIEIDVTNLKYSLTSNCMFLSLVKHHYTLIDMLNHFDRLTNNGSFSKQPAFNNHIEELISENRKQIGFTRYRDRSKTHTFEASDFSRLRADSILEEEKDHNGVKIPANNPLFSIGQVYLSKVSEKK